MSPEFNNLYHQLATAWESHQALRRADAPFPEIASSSIKLDAARSAMRDWHRRSR